MTLPSDTSTLLIKGATVVTMSNGGQVLSDADVFIRGNRIVGVGILGERANGDVQRVIDGHGKVLMPGLINTHTHSPMTFQRGTLEDTAYPSEEKHDKFTTLGAWMAGATPEDHFWSSLLGQAEMIRAGVTTFVDMYHDMDQVAQAVELSGMRGFLGWEIMSVRSDPVKFLVPDDERGRITYEECAEFATKWDGAAGGRVRAMIAPHETATCLEPWLSKSAQLAGELKLPITIHLAEVDWEVEYARKTHGMSAAQLLAETGILDHHVIAAHCVYLSPDDVKLLATADIHPTSCPQAMLKLAVPVIAPLYNMMQAGINVSLGTDSATTNNNLDLWKEMRLAPMLQRFLTGDGEALGHDTPLRMVTRNAATAVGMDDLGKIEIGCLADIILIDTTKPHWQPLNDLTAQLIYASNSSDVETVIIDGKVVMHNRVIETFDEARTIEQVNHRVARLKNRVAVRQV
jgi:5-methylthioadenosine/S-adenosylhomocysteine deaminase